VHVLGHVEDVDSSDGTGNLAFPHAAYGSGSLDPFGRPYSRLDVPGLRVVSLAGYPYRDSEHCDGHAWTARIQPVHLIVFNQGSPCAAIANHAVLAGLAWAIGFIHGLAYLAFVALNLPGSGAGYRSLNTLVTLPCPLGSPIVIPSAWYDVLSRPDRW